MIKKLFAVSFDGSESYSFTKSTQIIFQFVSMISGTTNETDVKIFGECDERKYLICKIKGLQSQRVSVTINEQNFHTLYCVGNGQVDLTGYTCQLREEEPQEIAAEVQNQIQEDEQKKEKEVEPPVFNDIFRALQPKEEKTVDTSQMTRYERRKYFKKQWRD